ncbi:hypothetical protein DITRI_Ditri20bG0035800 [Diplodiscus trichospermus]
MPCTYEGPIGGVDFTKKPKKKKTCGVIKTKFPSSIVRRKRKSTKVKSDKSVVKQATTPSISEFSLSDKDIEHRNSVILQEAEETWKVISVLGIVFDKEKDQLCGCVWLAYVATKGYADTVEVSVLSSMKCFRGDVVK